MPRSKAPRNSHHGCLQCKRRSVKCDEKRPKCSKCENRLDNCQYDTSGPWLWKTPTIAGQSGRTYREISFDSELSSSSEHAFGMSSSSQYSAFSTRSLDDLDLKLLRNWTTSTAPSLSRNDSDRQIWQTTVPREAATNPCLLHGVLAVSAIHLALNTDVEDKHEKWIKAAESHQSEAIVPFSSLIEKSQLQDIGSFALSSLLIGFAFAFPLAVTRQDQKVFQPLEEMIQIFTFIRSTMNFAAPVLTGPKSEELSRLTHVEETTSPSSKRPYPEIITLHELNSTRIMDPGDRQAFETVISLLDDLFASIDCGVEPVSKTFMWICDLPPRFHDLLREQNPFALVILAHYCIVLHRLRWLWWISSWGQRVLSEINEKLGPEWELSVEGPLDAIRRCGFL